MSVKDDTIAIAWLMLYMIMFGSIVGLFYGQPFAP